MGKHEQVLDAFGIALAPRQAACVNYGALGWLLDDSVSPGRRRARRAIYLKTLRLLDAEFRNLFDEWVAWSNGPDFEQIYHRRKRALVIVRKLRRCACLHVLHLHRMRDIERLVALAGESLTCARLKRA